MSRARSLVALTTTMIALATTSTAHAAATRAEYVAQVEPICQTAYFAEKAAYKIFQRRIKKAAQQIRRHGRPRKDARSTLFSFYGRMRQVSRTMDAAIQPIPPAPGDEAAVQAWLAGRERSITLNARALRALRRAKSRRFLTLFFKGIDTEGAAVSSVQDFGFSYCTRVSVVGPLA
jgi:hypothetical protein